MRHEGQRACTRVKKMQEIHRVSKLNSFTEAVEAEAGVCIRLQANSTRKRPGSLSLRMSLDSCTEKGGRGVGQRYA